MSVVGNSIGGGGCGVLELIFAKCVGDFNGFICIATTLLRKLLCVGVIN